MGLLQVKKVVAVCFLEATKLTLEQLGEHRVAMSQQGIQGSPDLPRLYGEARRLRDYLQRCASAFHDVVDLDLSDGDRSLLVACCRRAVEVIDLRILGEQAVAHDERQWLQRKRTVLTDWAVELVDRPPLLELPLPRLSPVQTEGSKALQARLHAKIFAGGHQKTILRGGQSAPSITAGVSSFGLDFAGIGEPSVTNPSASQPVVPAPAEPPAAAVIDVQRLRDPRLRSLATLDQRSFARAVAGQDYRLAAVLLASLLESAVLDHAVPRRAELGLTSSPDTWNVQEILAKAMGEAFTPKDKALAYHLFAARNLLRPALQLVSPTVVTHASLEKLQDLVQRAMHAMGFASFPTSPGMAFPADLPPASP